MVNMEQKEITLQITQKLDGKLLRDIIKGELAVSSKLLTVLKRQGLIFLNERAVNVTVRVKCGDTIKIQLPDEDGSDNVIPVNIPLEILYEDEDILAVNKPADMPTHPSMNNYDNTLGNAVMYYYRNSGFVFRPVNRLDRDTTGIVIVAKNRFASAALSSQMQKGIFKKTYFALVSGIIENDTGIIDAPIERELNSVIKRCVRDDGKRAVTEYEVVQRNKENNTTFVKITLHTGRTHQIRVHFAHIGHPLMYDFLYGKEENGKTVHLHCGKVSFIHPTSGSQMCIEAEIK